MGVVAHVLVTIARCLTYVLVITVQCLTLVLSKVSERLLAERLNAFAGNDN